MSTCLTYPHSQRPTYASSRSSSVSSRPKHHDPRFKSTFWKASQRRGWRLWRDKISLNMVKGEQSSLKMPPMVLPWNKWWRSQQLTVSLSSQLQHGKPKRRSRSSSRKLPLPLPRETAPTVLQKLKPTTIWLINLSICQTTQAAGLKP